MTEIWRDTEKETIRLYPFYIILLTSLQMTGIHVGDISILDWQVRFVKLEKILRYIQIATSDHQNCYLSSFFPQRMLGHFRPFRPFFLLRLFPRHRTATFRSLFSSIHSATFVGNATEATCRLLRIPFRFDSHERNPKSTQLFPPRPQTHVQFLLSSNCKRAFRTARPCSVL